MNIDVIMTIVLLAMVVVIVTIVMYSMQDYISSVDEKVDGLKQGYVPLDKHAKDIDESRKEDVVLHDRINYTNEKINKSFDGNYDNLKNKPNLFDGDYKKLKNKPSDTGDYNKLINKPRLFDGEYGSLKNKPDLFDGDYNKLENKPALFDGNYDNLENKPALFDGDYNNLENKPALFDGNYDSLTNVPNTFASNWSNIDDKPSKFPSSWDMIDGKPSNFANTWNNINEKPDHYPSRWDMIDDKPTFANAWDDIEGKPTTYDSTWDKVQGKPQQFPTSWDMIAGKPTGPAEYDDTEIRGMINGKAAIVHTHTMYDIQGIDSNLNTMLTNSLSEYALSDHQHSYRDITGLSGYIDRNLNTKSAIGHKHEASDINNLQSVINRNLPNLSGYATASALTRGLETKQGTLSRSTDVTVKNLTANGNISAGNRLTLKGGSPTLVLQDTNHRSSMIHCNGNKMHFLRGEGTDSTKWKTTNGAWPLVLNLENNHASFGGDVSIKGNVGNRLILKGGSPTLYLQDTNHRSSMIHCNSNKLYFLRGEGANSTKWKTTNGAWPLVLNLDNNRASFGGDVSIKGDLTTTGNITAFYSDRRLKTKISEINEPLKIINNLNGFYYRPNELAHKMGIKNTEIEIGLSAQDVQQVLPELVKLAPFDSEKNEDGVIVSKSGNNYLTVCYERLIPVLVESIKELNKKNNVLETKYNNLLHDMNLIKQKLNLF